MAGRFKDRTGVTGTMSNGLNAEIIAYRSSRSIDVQFENGCVVKNNQYGNFKDGNIRCPILIERIDDYAKVTNPNTDSVWLMDAEDLPLLDDYFWSKDDKGYICRDTHSELGLLRLHRVIMNASKDVQVDHRNGNKSDNRKQNLRRCTNTENQHNVGRRPDNTSGYKGVGRYKSGNKWIARICCDGKRKHLGYYDTPEQAAQVYNEAAIRLHGEFARLNEI